MDDVGKGPDERHREERYAEQDDMQHNGQEQVGEPNPPAVHHPRVGVHLAVSYAHIHLQYRERQYVRIGMSHSPTYYLCKSQKKKKKAKHNLLKPKLMSSNVLFCRSTVIQFTTTLHQEKQQILTVKKVEVENIWHSYLKTE